MISTFSHAGPHKGAYSCKGLVGREEAVGSGQESGSKCGYYHYTASKRVRAPSTSLSWMWLATGRRPLSSNKTNTAKAENTTQKSVPDTLLINWTGLLGWQTPACFLPWNLQALSTWLRSVPSKPFLPSAPICRLFWLPDLLSSFLLVKIPSVLRSQTQMSLCSTSHCKCRFTVSFHVFYVVIRFIFCFSYLFCILISHLIFFLCDRTSFLEMYVIDSHLNGMPEDNWFRKWSCMFLWKIISLPSSVCISWVPLPHCPFQKGFSIKAYCFPNKNNAASLF